MATSKKVITRAEWEKKLNDVKVRKEDMNKLVMNFLVTQGYVEAAEKFRLESGTEYIDLATITDRMAVKNEVQSGNVEDAIEKVNDLNPEILDTNPQLYFHLQQQRLIEFIQNGKVEEALEFAQEELALRGEENKSWKGLLHCLLLKMWPIALLASSLIFLNCLKMASEVNAAILTSQSHEKDYQNHVLFDFLRPNRSKASEPVENADKVQNQLDEKATYPQITDLSTAALEDPAV